MARIDTITNKIKSNTRFMLCVRFMRILFFFYAFISFVFWFLNCFEVDWIYQFEKLFIVPYKIVRSFYQPQGVSADFSLAIIGGASLLLGFFCDFWSNILIRIIDNLEDERDKQIQLKRKKDRMKRQEARAAVSEVNNNVRMENSMLLFIIMPHVNKIKRKETDLELTFQEVDLWKQRVNKKFIDNIIYSKPMQKGYYRKNLFLVYKDFNYVDEFIYYAKPTLDSIIMEFKKYGIFVSFCYVLSALSLIENLEKELDCMDTILSLNFINQFIATQRFKINYDNKARAQYTLQYKGEYNLSKNLSITNNQPLYILSENNRTGASK